MIKSIPIKYSIFEERDNPLFGDDITYVSLEDEAGGPFIILEQPTITATDGEIRLELKELEEILRISKQMIDEYNRYNKEIYDTN